MTPKQLFIYKKLNPAQKALYKKLTPEQRQRLLEVLGRKQAAQRRTKRIAASSRRVK